MFIEKIILSNFRCFAEITTEIKLEKDITCLIGNNGSGKTAIITAFKRLFGSSREDRLIRKDDFHSLPNDTDNELKNKEMYIDVLFSFSNSENPSTEYPYFPAIYADEETKEFKMRIRLEAKWDINNYEDEVDTSLYWVLTSQEIDFGDDTTLKLKLNNSERRLINLITIPAIRDVNTILKNDIKRIIKKIEKYIDIEENLVNSIEEKSKDLCNDIKNINAVKSITSLLDDIWSNTHDNTINHYQKTSLEASPDKLNDILKSISPKLSPSDVGGAKDIEDLSDGQISLFYLALSLALFELDIKHNKSEIKGLKELDIEPPVFTIFALEEPENHLSPFYLSKIINLLYEKNKIYNLINLVTSHSPNVVRRMKRIEQIRFLHQELSNNARFSVVKNIELPENKNEDDYKYINQAILSHPELYFSKLVILGEGDSEEIVIPYIANKLGLDLDPSFISFVKLGGRHVNHMWKLLNKLKIPYITLLDFDLGREHGGIDKINYIIKELDKIENSFEYPEGLNVDSLTENISKEELNTFIMKLREYNIFFSYPLDLDMLMIDSFKDCYKDNGNNGTLEEFTKSILGKNGDFSRYKTLYKDIDLDILKKYRYLFCGKSKVSSHYIGINNISKIEENIFSAKCPEPLKTLIGKAIETLKLGADNE